MRTLPFLVVFIAFATLSCVSQRKCLKRFPPSVDTIKTTIIKDSIIIRDSLIPYLVQGETRIDSIFIPCPPQSSGYVSDTAKVETQFATGYAWWDAPFIRLKVIQRDTAILLKVALREAYHWKSEYEKITTIPKPVKYIPQIYKISLWVCIGIFILGLVYIVGKVTKFLPF